MRPADLTGLILATSLALCAPRARAHDAPRERGVLVQMNPDSVDVMLTYHEPASDQTALHIARFDVNHDGRLSQEEAAFAGQTWLPRALAGLSFEVVGHAPRALKPQVKFKIDPDGGLSMAALVRYELPQLDAQRARALRVQLADGHLKTALHLQAPKALAIERVNARPVAPIARSGPYMLTGPGSIEVGFAPLTR